MKTVNYLRKLTAEAIVKEAERREDLTLNFLDNTLMELMTSAAKMCKNSCTCAKAAMPSDVVWDIVKTHLELRGFDVVETDKNVTITW